MCVCARVRACVCVCVLMMRDFGGSAVHHRKRGLGCFSSVSAASPALTEEYTLGEKQGTRKREAVRMGSLWLIPSL